MALALTARMVPDTPLARPAPFLLPHAQFEWQAVVNASAGWAWSPSAAASIAFGSALSIELRPSAAADEVGTAPPSTDSIAALARVDAMVPLTIAADVFSVDVDSVASRALSPAWAVRSQPVAPGWVFLPFDYTTRRVTVSYPETLDWQLTGLAQRAPPRAVQPVGIAANVSSVTWQVTGVPIKGAYGLPASVNASVSAALLHNLSLSSSGLALRLPAGTLRAAYVYVITPVALTAAAHWTADLSPLLSVWAEELGLDATALARGALLPGGHPTSIVVRLCGQGIRLMTKMPPSGGALAASPANGTAFVDVFRFNTSSWTTESSLFALTDAAAAVANSSDLVTALAPIAWPGVVASALARRLANRASPIALFDAATACTELSTPRTSLDLTALPVPAPWWFTLASVLAAAGGGGGPRASVTALCRQMLDGVGPTSSSLLTTFRPSAALRFSFRVDTSGSPSPPLAIVDASSPIALVRALALVNADSGLASQTTWPGLALSNLTVESSWASLLSQSTSAPLNKASALAYVLAVDADGSAGIAWVPLSISPLINRSSLPDITHVASSVAMAVERVLHANPSTGVAAPLSPFSTLYLLADLGALVSQSVLRAEAAAQAASRPPPAASIVSRALDMHVLVATRLLSTLQAASSSVPSGATGVPLSDYSLSQLSKFALGMAGVATSHADAAAASAASVQQLGLAAMQAALSLAQHGDAAAGAAGRSNVSTGTVLPLQTGVAQTVLDAISQLTAIPSVDDEQLGDGEAADRVLRAVDNCIALLAAALTRGESAILARPGVSIYASAISPGDAEPCPTMVLTVSRMVVGSLATGLQLGEPEPPCGSRRRRLQTAALQPLPVVTVDSARVELAPGASSFTVAVVQWTADPTGGEWDPSTPHVLPCNNSSVSHHSFCSPLLSNVPDRGAAGRVLSVRLVDGRGQDVGVAVSGSGSGLVSVALQVDPFTGPAAVTSQLPSEPVPFSLVCPSFTAPLSDLVVPSFANVSVSVPFGPPLGAGLPVRLYSITYRNITVPTLLVDAAAGDLAAPPALGSGSELALDPSSAASSVDGGSVLVRAPYFLLEVDCISGGGGATPTAFLTCGYGAYGKRASGACPHAQPVPVCARVSDQGGSIGLGWTTVGAGNASAVLPAPGNVTCEFDAGGYVGLRWALVPSATASDASVVIDDLAAPTAQPVAVARSSGVLVAVLVVLATTLLLLPLAQCLDAEGASRFYAALLDDEEVIFLHKLFELTGRPAVVDITIDGVDGSGGGATLFSSGGGGGGGIASDQLESVANPALSRRGAGSSSPRVDSPRAGAANGGGRGSVYGVEGGSKSVIALAALRLGATLRGIGLRGHGEGEGAGAAAAPTSALAASQKKVPMAPAGARKGAGGGGGKNDEFAFVNPGTQLSAKARMRIAGGGAKGGGSGGAADEGEGGFMSPLKSAGRPDGGRTSGEQGGAVGAAADGDGSAANASSPTSSGAANPFKRLGGSNKDGSALSTPGSLSKSRTFTLNAAAAAVAATGAAQGDAAVASAEVSMTERDGSRALIGLVSGMHTGEGGLSTGLRYLDPLASALYLRAVRALDPARLSAETISDVLAASPSRLLLRLRPADLPRSQGRVYALPTRNPLRTPLLDGVSAQRELGTPTLSAALVNFKLPRRLLRTIRSIERLTLGLRDVVKGIAGGGARGGELAAGAPVAASAASVLCGDVLACGRQGTTPLLDPLPSCVPWCWRLAARHSLASLWLLFDPLLTRATRALLAASSLLTTLWCAALFTSLAAGSSGSRSGGFGTGGGFSAGALGVIGLLAALLTLAIQGALHVLLAWGGAGDYAARHPLLAQEMARRVALESALSRVSLGRLHQEVAAGIAPDTPTLAATSARTLASPGVRSNPLASRRVQRGGVGSPGAAADTAASEALPDAAGSPAAGADTASPLSASKRRARSKKGLGAAGAEGAAPAASPATATDGGTAGFAPAVASPTFSPVRPPLPAVMDEDDALRFGWRGAGSSGSGGGGCLTAACAPLLLACGRHPSQRAAFLARRRAAELERGLDREAFESLDDALASSPRSASGSGGFGGRRGGGKGGARGSSSSSVTLVLAGLVPSVCRCGGSDARRRRGGGASTRGAFGGTDDAAPSMWSERAPLWLQWWFASWSARGVLAHGVLLGWLGWVSAYLCVWGRFHADGPAGQLLAAWGIGVVLVLAALEPLAALGAPLALHCCLGCARACRPLLLLLLPSGGGGAAAPSTSSRFSLDGALRASPLTLRLRFVTLLRAAGHASGLRPHTAFVALAPTWLLVAVATSPPPASSSAEAALQAAATARGGGGGGSGRPLTKAAQAQLKLAAAVETRRTLSLKRYSLALLRSVAASMKQ